MVKNFFKNGKWIENPNEPAIEVCECGNKYIKTRKGQEVCLMCITDVRV
ncbi:MAG: hypothetical protein Q8P19_01555 [bacterium]|nr:hypothetical protein [bacterium]